MTGASSSVRTSGRAGRLTTWRLDSLQLMRDPFLRWFIATPFLMAFAFRLLVPVLIEALEDVLSVELAAHAGPVLAGTLCILAPLLLGTVAGFHLLDLRDEGALLALRTAPTTLEAWLLGRLAVPTVLAIPLTWAAGSIVGLVWSPSVVLAVAVASAPLAPLVALALLALARDKVQGFVLVKVSAFVTLPPLAVLLTAHAAAWLLVPFPTFAPMQAGRLLSEGSGWGWLWVGVAWVHAGALAWWLGRLAQRRLD